MARYIDADALIERLLKLKVVTDDMYGMGIARGIERAETAIQMQPTADVAPKSEVAREIMTDLAYNKNLLPLPSWAIEELIKKYTEGK